MSSIPLVATGPNPSAFPSGSAGAIATTWGAAVLPSSSVVGQSGGIGIPTNPGVPSLVNPGSMARQAAAITQQVQSQMQENVKQTQNAFSTPIVIRAPSGSTLTRQ